jgi:hypothetical protein
MSTHAASSSVLSRLIDRVGVLAPSSVLSLLINGVGASAPHSNFKTWPSYPQNGAVAIPRQWTHCLTVSWTPISLPHLHAILHDPSASVFVLFNRAHFNAPLISQSRQLKHVASTSRVARRHMSSPGASSFCWRPVSACTQVEQIGRRDLFTTQSSSKASSTTVTRDGRRAGSPRSICNCMSRCFVQLRRTSSVPSATMERSWSSVTKETSEVPGLSSRVKSAVFVSVSEPTNLLETGW